MTVIDGFGGGYNVQERPVEYYKTNSKDKSLNTKQVINTDFKTVLKSNKNIKNNSAKMNFNKPVHHNGLDNPNGTEIAQLKKVAKEYTDQFYGFLWNQMSEGINENPEGGFGEAIFQKSLWPELVKAASADGLDKVGEAVFKDLMRQQGYKEKNDIK